MNKGVTLQPLAVNKQFILKEGKITNLLDYSKINQIKKNNVTIP